MSARATAIPTPAPELAPTEPATAKPERSCSALIATVGAVIVARLLIQADVVLSIRITEAMPLPPSPEPMPEVGATP